ncbi:YqgE/AlgH family protein [Candidatus Schneideria nysicola]|uniref:YqgE/AlgH family protein n=1 Tax=Candidatus Schneideria nysicola TaxID=1081631 RepID=UPI001CAA44F1|nr:YqgE/AlgH family protein [Candidatus Schneideria nysicola]UAJ65181.1 YqgE/AlgH family protein [Candidatus Schneideria nysicola]UAJ65715.1 YqgE/AlgH family protein [Candidatus Schneideria nysicola]UAJ66242.1 YqgE/AlgH family protein [Candidatus Schneideria nysicola]
MNLQHHFLIAMPSLQDPIFRKSVVYICEHNKNGAIGLVINKPVYKFTFKNVLNKLQIASDDTIPSVYLDKPVFSGGPIADDHGFILHTPQEGFGSSVNISPQTMITTSKDILENLGTINQPNEILLIFGYSGWKQGQLEKEILENTWLIAPANNEILFHTPISSRWREAAKTIKIDIYNIANQIGHA